MFKTIKKFIYKKLYDSDKMLSDKSINSCLNLKYTVSLYENPFDVIRIELYYHSSQGKYISSIIKCDPSEKRKFNIINKEYDNFVDAILDFQKICKKYYVNVYEGIKEK